MTTTTPSNEKVDPVGPLRIELRDYFAGQALAGLTGCITEELYTDIANGARGGKYFGVVAYRIADAMLAERAKEAPDHA